MRTLNGWIGGLGGSAALTAGVIAAALTATGYVAFHDGGGLHLPGKLGRISVGHDSTTSAPIPAAPRPQPIAVGRVVVHPQAGGPSHTQRHRAAGQPQPQRKPRRGGSTHPVPKSPAGGGGQPTPPVASQPSTAPLTSPPPSGGGGNGGGGGQSQHPLTDAVRNTTQQLGNTVGGTTQAVGDTLGSVSPALATTVTGTGQLLGDTLNGTGQTVGNTLDGLLGGH